MAESRGMWEGVGVALVTPFRKGALDTDALSKLTEYLVGQGVRSFYPCGCTGEATSLSREERGRVLAAVREATKGKAALIAGTGTATTDETIDLSREAIRLGADGVMVITPYSCRPTQEGLLAHYRAVADAIDRPIVLYNVPSRTGVSIAPETVARLAEHSRIAAIKEASGSVETTSVIRSLCDIAVMAGDDSLFLPLMAIGAMGVVSVAGHLIAPDLVDLHRKFGAGEVEEAGEIHRRIHPLLRALFLETNPGPVKHALHRQGRIAPELRLPLVPVRPETAAAVDRALEQTSHRAPARAAG